MAVTVGDGGAVMWVPSPVATSMAVTILRGTPASDRYNAVRVDHTTATEMTVRGYVQERTSSESTSDVQSMSFDATAWLPPGTDVAADDLVRAAGVVWRVVGVKRLVWGAFRHIEVSLVREEPPPWM